jgi:acyl carrier protein
MNTEAAIEQFILDELLYGGGPTELGADDSLISSGLLDSMALLRLIVFIEEQFSVSVADGELMPENFQTVSLIKAFVERKQNGR